MKKRNYVVAISLIALLGQTGGLSAMDWAREKAGRAKAATVDSLYKKSKDFVKEVRTLKRCHKAGDCTSAQYRKIKRMGAAVAVTAAAVAIGVGIGATAVGFGVSRHRAQTKEQIYQKFPELIQGSHNLPRNIAINEILDKAIKRKKTLAGLEQEIADNKALSFSVYHQSLLLSAVRSIYESNN